MMNRKSEIRIANGSLPLPSRNERGEGWGEGYFGKLAAARKFVPPLPSPLLHPMEEREKLLAMPDSRLFAE